MKDLLDLLCAFGQAQSDIGSIDQGNLLACRVLPDEGMVCLLVSAKVNRCPVNSTPS